MPHTGDIPNTVFSTAHSAMIIEPLNYLLGDPSQASTQQVLIKTTDGKPVITTYGAKNATCPVDMVCLCRLWFRTALMCLILGTTQPGSIRLF
jgi:primary-amine oxidase